MVEKEMKVFFRDSMTLKYIFLKIFFLAFLVVLPESLKAKSSEGVVEYNT
jgi:hypothetical protein